MATFKEPWQIDLDQRVAEYDCLYAKQYKMLKLLNHPDAHVLASQHALEICAAKWKQDQIK